MSIDTELRLLLLFCRSRRAGSALAWLVATTAFAWVLLRRGDDRLFGQIILLVLPVGPAALVGASLPSPFGDAERIASRPLPALRLAHLAALLLIGGAGLAMANGASPWPGTEWVLVRNGVGYAGLALVGALLVGAPGAWALPLAYGALAFVVVAARQSPADIPAWAWAYFPAADRPATAVATLLFATGLAAAVLLGAHDAPGGAGWPSS